MSYATLLDLSKTYKSFPCGMITCHLSWTQDDRRPCLALVPTLAPMHFDRMRPCIVRIGHAYRWDEHTGSGRYAAHNSIRFCRALQFEVTPRICFQITDIIREHLGDLLMCPPMPIIMAQTEVAIATIRDRNTGQIRQTGITEDV